MKGDVMNEKLNELKQKLDNLHTAVSSITFPQPDLIDAGNYHYPFLHAEDLVYFPKMLSEKIGKMTKFEPSEHDIEIIDSIIYSLDKSQPNLNHLSHGNSTVSGPAIASYLVSMLYISIEINELFSFEVLNNKELLPKKIINRLGLYQSNLQAIEEKTGNIESKIDTINEAYDAAESLPTTLKSLRDTNEKINELNENSERNANSIGDRLEQAKIDSKELTEIKNNVAQLHKDVAKEASDYLNQLKVEAQGYIDKCEEAFRTTTSKGLAGAFEDKAIKLNASIRLWVAGLIAALGAGAIVGYTRLHALEAYLSSPNSSGIKLTIQLILSILSVGAPLWFAWLATKQIGQRFRLAEDYEFKASVSKAYEGYRREAMQLDADFSQRLFGNALTRLEEPPLRFVEETAHSSPIMEMLSSDGFKNLVDRGGDKIDSILEKAGLVRKQKINKDIPERKVISNEDE
jgi:F0F1-type ATP synthase membrane subunit b/b'